MSTRWQRRQLVAQANEHAKQAIVELAGPGAWHLAGGT